MAISPSAAILTTSYKLFATGLNSQQNQIGSAISMSPSESRTIIDSFAIGSNPPDVPVELIAGIVTGRTLSMHAVALYTTEVMDNFKTDAQSFIASLSDQNTPFSVQESIQNPTTGKTKTRTYSGCFLQDFRSSRDIANTDIRELSDVTIRYQSVTATNYQ